LIPLQPGQDLEFRLEFTPSSLRRIVAFSVHPSAIYPSNNAGARTIPCTLTAAANFSLWLLARPHNPNSIKNGFREKDFRLPGAAPYTTMRRHIAREKSSRRILGEAPIRKTLSYLGSKYLEGGMSSSCADAKLHRRSMRCGNGQKSTGRERKPNIT
jgi:hypothetical protein